MNGNTLSNKFFKKPTAQKKSLCNCQRNLSVTLLRKAKKISFGNINEKVVTDNNFFWQSIRPLLLDKVKSVRKLL